MPTQFVNSFHTLLKSERWRAAMGAFLGMGLSAVFLHSVSAGTDSHWVLVPLAGAIVILYVQPHNPVAQP